jgi:CRP-like cAMP-binding protein
MAKTRLSGTGNHDLVSLLAEVPLFAGLPKKRLATLAEMFREHHFSAGEVIVAEGDTSGRFYVIVDGGAEVRVHGRAVNLLGPGQYFGEFSVIDREPRSASVVATTPVHAHSLGSITLRPLLREEPEITYQLLLNTCQRIRALERGGR